MSVKLRLSRIGKKNDPRYRIVAIDSRRQRDGKFLEDLGTYDPIHHKIVQFHADRVEDWVSKGAVMSETVKRLHKQYKKGAQAGA